MAKMDTIVLADFDELVYVVENCILDGSATASLEDGSDYVYDHARCAVRVFERQYGRQQPCVNECHIL